MSSVVCSYPCSYAIVLNSPNWLVSFASSQVCNPHAPWFTVDILSVHFHPSCKSAFVDSNCFFFSTTTMSISPCQTGAFIIERYFIRQHSPIHSTLSFPLGCNAWRLYSAFIVDQFGSRILLTSQRFHGFQQRSNDLTSKRWRRFTLQLGWLHELAELHQKYASSKLKAAAPIELALFPHDFKQGSMVCVFAHSIRIF